MKLQCTKKLLSKLKVESLNDSVSPEKHEAIKNWHCNLLQYGRKKALLMTNDETLFSFFVFDVRSEELRSIKHTLQDSAFKIMLSLGFEQKQIEYILVLLEEITITSTSDRSVTASMNQIKVMLDSALERGADVIETNKRINESIYGRINYDRPINRFRALLNENI